MKKIIFTAFFCFATLVGYAQNVQEPEYNGQVALVNADSTITLLKKEIGSFKAKSSSFGLIPVPGAALLDKTKSFLTIKGNTSPNVISSKTFSFVIRVKDNNEEPKNSFGIFKFEKKKKERRYQVLEAGVTSGVSENFHFNNVDYTVHKFGGSSYYITVENLEPGEYGIVTSGLDNIATFCVK